MAFSLSEVESLLPEKFLESLRLSYNQNIINKVLKGIISEKKTTCRVNTLKTDISGVIKSLREYNIKFHPVPWYKNAMILDCSRREIENTSLYRDGLIYLQSLSSMIPPIVLEPRENEKILDIAAAPGSKTTQIASIINNKGLIVAYESNPIRFEKLSYNVKLQGAFVNCILDKGENCEYENYFDKVLIDAPCSGEGKFRIKDPKTYKVWSEKLVRNSIKIQKKLLEAGIKSCKKGGIIVYSTCTLNREENENIVEWALKEMPVSIKEISIENFNLSTIPTIKGCLKVIQSQISEGFFVSKFIKVS